MLIKLNNTTFQGTVQDFVKAGLKVNGFNIDAVTLSGMVRYKLLPQVGEQKPARGRSAAVYEIDTQKNPAFSL